MAQRIYNLSKWCWIPEGQSMPFPNTKRRQVVLEVNSQCEVDLFVMVWKSFRRDTQRHQDERAGRASRTVLPVKSAEGAVGERPGTETIFVAHCMPGRDTIDFFVDGSFELFAEGGPVYVYSNDSQQTELHVVAPEVFTRIANRRSRNPQLEIMMWQQRQNLERRFNQLAADTERRIMEASQGSKVRYAKPRDVRAPENRRVDGASPVRQAQSDSARRSDVREAGSDRSQGRDGEAVEVAERVSETTAKSRGKAKQTT